MLDALLDALIEVLANAGFLVLWFGLPCLIYYLIQKARGKWDKWDD